MITFKYFLEKRICDYSTSLYNTTTFRPHTTTFAILGLIGSFKRDQRCCNVQAAIIVALLPAKNVEQSVHYATANASPKRSGCPSSLR